MRSSSALSVVVSNRSSRVSKCSKIQALLFALPMDTGGSMSPEAHHKPVILSCFNCQWTLLEIMYKR
uniref:Uncharacterized protein n=1 Tax=Arundo donax TaxID=35708 RepID=A0A0A9E025_ARUDO